MNGGAGRREKSENLDITEGVQSFALSGLASPAFIRP